MRISTSQIYSSGAKSIMDGQSSLYKIQNQLSSGKKFLSAQDNPVAAAQVLLDSQAMAINSQYSDNQSNALSQLGFEESQLQAVVAALQDARANVVAGGNGSYTDAEREFIADELESKYELLLGLANSADANGYYLFSGYQGNTKPFEEVQLSDGSVAVNYTGDDGQRLLQVGSNRQIAVSDSGNDIFQNVSNGNGTYAVSTGTANSGTGVIDAGSVVDMTAWSGDSFQIDFVSGTEFNITDTTTGSTFSGGPFAYSAGAAITQIDGISFSISGAPAAGDVFTVEPSTNQSVFTTLQNLITAFRTDISGDSAAGAKLRNTMNIELQNLDQALTNASGVRSTVGARMNELESLQSVSSSLELQYKEKISNLQDIDYAAAISDYQNQYLQLQAAQSSFAKISGMSLFNYL